MKTNNKKHPVFPYLISCIDEEIEGTTAERLTEVLSRFKSEYVYPDNLKRYGNYQSLFSQWLMGLPSALNIEYRNFAILELAKEWGSVPDNPTERQEEKIISNWFNFIATKFFQLCKQYKVNPFDHIAIM